MIWKQIVCIEWKNNNNWNNNDKEEGSCTVIKKDVTDGDDNSRPFHKFYCVECIYCADRSLGLTIHRPINAL